jgi:UDP-sulfoquinovose synthase (EC 3.13.1.1)
MKVLLLGIDGELGWPLALKLAKSGHEVIGVDNLSTRRMAYESSTDSVFPLPSPAERVREAKRHLDVNINFIIGDITQPGLLKDLIRKFKPDAIVHFAEQRSAPYSMKDEEHAVFTIQNNLIGTMRLVYAVKEVDPTMHIVKMGTMGEYGTPNFDIPEDIEVEAEITGKRDRILVPRKGGSWYHWSKVFDTDILYYANQLWGLTVTDIMQGPVYGTRTSEIVHESLRTRFDIDEAWGTVVNRFCAEAVIGHPLTVYGKGGQTRGFISLEDSVMAVKLLIEHPPDQGKYRVVNQFAEVYSVRQIAEIVKEAAEKVGLGKVEMHHLENPRVEKEEHYYNPTRRILPSLGFRPTRTLRDEVPYMLEDLLPYKERIERFREGITPKTKWR